MRSRGRETKNENSSEPGVDRDVGTSVSSLLVHHYENSFTENVCGVRDQQSKIKKTVLGVGPAFLLGTKIDNLCVQC